MERRVELDESTATKKSNEKSEKLSMPFKGIIFDMDGTLIESTEADFLAWQKTFADIGKKLSFEDYQPLLGVKSADVIKNVMGIVDEDEVKKYLAAKLQHFKEIITLKPIVPVSGAKELLEQVKKLPVKIALATSSRNAKMKLVMTQLNFLQYFDEVVTGEEVNNSKPAPDIFILAAKRLGFNANECIVIEDAVNGVKSAKAANMKCIAISTTHAKETLHEADIVIDSYKNLDFKKLCLAL